MVWPDNSPYVEVYDPQDQFPDVPIAAIDAGSHPRSKKSLTLIAYSSSDFTKF